MYTFPQFGGMPRFRQNLSCLFLNVFSVSISSSVLLFTWIIATIFGRWFIAHLLRPDLSNASTLLKY